MGWIPQSSFFKVAIDDFYTTSELEDYPVQRQYDLGLPVGNFFEDGALLVREFEGYWVVVNLSDQQQTFESGNHSVVVPASGVEFLLKQE